MLYDLVTAEKLADPYIAAGDRAYIVGAQDGGFPDLGWHVKGEMGGLWVHPIKLIDGFWLQVDGAWLAAAQRFIGGPFWNAHEYVLPDGPQVTRRQFAPDGEPAMVVRYTFRSAISRTLMLRLLARTDLQGVWLSDKDGLRDGYDHATYAADLGAWVCRDDCNPWYVVVGARELEPRGYASGRDLWGPEQTRGRGVSVALDYELAVPAGGEAYLEFVVAGSDAGAIPARARRAGSSLTPATPRRRPILSQRSGRPSFGRAISPGTTPSASADCWSGRWWHAVPTATFSPMATALSRSKTRISSVSTRPRTRSEALPPWRAWPRCWVRTASLGVAASYTLPPTPAWRRHSG